MSLLADDIKLQAGATKKVRHLFLTSAAWAKGYRKNGAEMNV